MRLWPAVLFLGTAGCHAAIPIVAAIGGSGATIVAVKNDANLTLDVADPINALIVCPFAEKDAHDAKTLAAIKAFCANLPNTVEDIPAQAIAVVKAIEATP